MRIIDPSMALLCVPLRVHLFNIFDIRIRLMRTAFNALTAYAAAMVSCNFPLATAPLNSQASIYFGGVHARLQSSNSGRPKQSTARKLLPQFFTTGTGSATGASSSMSTAVGHLAQAEGADGGHLASANAATATLFSPRWKTAEKASTQPPPGDRAAAATRAKFARRRRGEERQPGRGWRGGGGGLAPPRDPECHDTCVEPF